MAKTIDEKIAILKAQKEKQELKELKELKKYLVLLNTTTLNKLLSKVGKETEVGIGTKMMKTVTTSALQKAIDRKLLSIDFRETDFS